MKATMNLYRVTIQSLMDLNIEFKTFKTGAGRVIQYVWTDGRPIRTIFTNDGRGQLNENEFVYV